MNSRDSLYNAPAKRVSNSSEIEFFSEIDNFKRDLFFQIWAMTRDPGRGHLLHAGGGRHPNCSKEGYWGRSKRVAGSDAIVAQ